jgi:hypothetical protein
MRKNKINKNFLIGKNCLKLKQKQKKVRDREIYCTATKSVIYYTQLTYRRNPMFDFLDFEKQFEEVTAQVKKANKMWIDWTITMLEQFKK